MDTQTSAAAGRLKRREQNIPAFPAWWAELVWVERGMVHPRATTRAV